MGTGKRIELVSLRMTLAETAMLSDLAAELGVYQADAIRHLVRSAHGERFGRRKTGPRRRSGK